MVVDANSYSAIVGNDWLSKVRARLDYDSCTMLITWNNKDMEVLIEYQCMSHERMKLNETEPTLEGSKEELEDDEEEDEDEEYEEEYEEEELDEKLFCHFHIESNTTKTSTKAVALTRRWEDPILEGILPVQEIVLVNSGVYLEESFHP